MSLWSESIAARCRGSEQWHNELQNADVIWEDSILGPSGHVFVIGTIEDKYFYAKWNYEPYLSKNYVSTELNIFPTIETLKEWLRDLRSEGHPKAPEILSIMKFLLT